MEWKEYKTKLPNQYSKENLAVIKKAFNFAAEIHKNMTRLTGEPYITHPARVSFEAAELKLDAAAVTAALLHDTHETEDAALKKISKEFGSEIAFLVNGVTKANKLKYEGIERSAESMRKMFMAMAQDIRVVIIKLLDRLHNLETLYAFPQEKQKRIAIETLEIFAPVADRLGLGRIRLQMEDAAFKYAYPEEYNWIIKETHEKIPEREKYLAINVIPVLEKELQKEKISVIKMAYRAKHYYSLWRKLLRNNMDWHSIYDMAAVRIIVPSTENCYATLGVIHKLWKPLPGRIKDYISLPKQNGYQSLHTTVFCVDKKVTEFQIRTPQMHEEAEQGIAAHWAWEMLGKPRQAKNMPHQKFEWVKQLKDWHGKFNKNLGGKEFLESLKIDFFKDRVFVLTPKGDIIDLPEGATPVDFAYHIHSEMGNSIAGVKVNNHIVPLSYVLASGDMVEIMVQKNKKPNLKLLDYAKTSLAKNHIKAAFKKHGIIMNFLKKPQENKNKTKFNIIAEDRVGMIKDIASILSQFRVNIESMTTKEKENENNNYTIISLTFTSRNKKQAEKIAIRLKNIKGVEEIEIKTN